MQIRLWHVEFTEGLVQFHTSCFSQGWHLEMPVRNGVIFSSGRGAHSKMASIFCEETRVRGRRWGVRGHAGSIWGIEGTQRRHGSAPLWEKKHGSFCLEKVFFLTHFYQVFPKPTTHTHTHTHTHMLTVGWIIVIMQACVWRVLSEVTLCVTAMCECVMRGWMFAHDLILVMSTVFDEDEAADKAALLLHTHTHTHS